LTPERQTYVVDGDPDGQGGGHRSGLKRSGKTEFPASWDDEKIIREVRSVARMPDRVVYQEPPSGLPSRYLMFGVRDDVTIRMIVESDGTICTGHPTKGPGVVQNPRVRSR